jgi:hypothetical protein
VPATFSLRELILPSLYSLGFVLTARVIFAIFPVIPMRCAFCFRLFLLPLLLALTPALQAKTVQLPPLKQKIQQGSTCWAYATITALQYHYQNKFKQRISLDVSRLIKEDRREKSALGIADPTGFVDRALQLVDRIGLYPENAKNDSFEWQGEQFDPKSFADTFFERPALHEYKIEGRISERGHYGPMPELWKRKKGFWSSYEKSVIKNFSVLEEKIRKHIDQGKTGAVSFKAGFLTHEETLVGYFTDKNDNFAGIILQNSLGAHFNNLGLSELKEKFVSIVFMDEADDEN